MHVILSQRAGRKSAPKKQTTEVAAENAISVAASRACWRTLTGAEPAGFVEQFLRPVGAQPVLEDLQVPVVGLHRNRGSAPAKPYSKPSTPYSLSGLS